MKQLVLLTTSFVCALGVAYASVPATTVSVSWTPDPLRQEIRLNGTPIQVVSQPLILTVPDGATPPTVEVRSCVAQTTACGPWRTVTAWKGETD